MVADWVVATVVAVLVTASFPFYLYGAWIIVDAETVTWAVLTHHLRYIGVGLALTTVPVENFGTSVKLWYIFIYSKLSARSQPSFANRMDTQKLLSQH